MFLLSFRKKKVVEEKDLTVITKQSEAEEEAKKAAEYTCFKCFVFTSQYHSYSLFADALFDHYCRNLCQNCWTYRQDFFCTWQELALL